MHVVTEFQTTALLTLRYFTWTRPKSCLESMTLLKLLFYFIFYIYYFNVLILKIILKIKKNILIYF
jgi:hypothetical protein